MTIPLFVGLQPFPPLIFLLKGNLDFGRTLPSGYIYTSLSLLYCFVLKKVSRLCFPTIYGLGVLDTTTFGLPANWLAATTSFFNFFFVLLSYISRHCIFGELGYIVVSGFAYFSIWSFCVTSFLSNFDDISVFPYVVAVDSLVFALSLCLFLVDKRRQEGVRSIYTTDFFFCFARV